MFEGKKVKADKKGRVSYNRNILNSIVTLATSEIAGVEPIVDGKRLCRIDFVDNDVYVNVSIRVVHGYSVSDIACKIQENIKRGVETMTSFRVKEVNIRVGGVVFPESDAGKTPERA